MGFSKDDYIYQIINDLKKIDYIKPDDIPNIDLYMDQVTTFMDEHLKSSKRYDDDKMLTKTMINNYTKNNLLPSPNKKKYSKEHMLLLIFIYYFKNILSISDIQHILGPLTDKVFHKKSQLNLEDIYEEVFSFEREQIDTMIKDVVRKYTKSRDTFNQAETEEDREFLNNFSFICMLSFDVYVKKTIIEKLIDRTVEGMGKKDSSNTKAADTKPVKEGKSDNGDKQANDAKPSKDTKSSKDSNIVK